VDRDSDGPVGGAARRFRTCGRSVGPQPPAGPPVPALPPLTQAAIDKAAPVLAATRQALGGDKIAAVRTLTARARRAVCAEQPRADPLRDGSGAPDKYLRKDESPFDNSEPTSLGFNGSDLLQVPPPATPPARAGAPPVPQAALDAARAGRIRTVKQDFVRFALGMFAQSFDTYP
jgi:hypothetical protein